MKQKFKDIFAGILGFVGFFIAIGAVGRMETDMYFPLLKGVVLILLGLTLLGTGFVIGRWDQY